VILVDANLLIYAHVASLPQHAAAREWLDRQLNGTSRVGLPWESALAFLRSVTNPRVFAVAEPVAEAWEQVRAWWGCETVWIPQPTERHADLMEEFVRLPVERRQRLYDELARAGADYIVVQLANPPEGTDRSWMPIEHIGWVKKVR